MPSRSAGCHNTHQSEGMGSTSGTQNNVEYLELQERNHSIKFLEVTAVKLALLRFQSCLQGNPILVQPDNMSMVAYLNNQGGTRSIALHAEIVETMEWVNKTFPSLKVRHIKREQKQKADWLSRCKINYLE